MGSGSESLACGARALARLNGGLLRLFDQRTVAALRAIAPLRPVLAHLEPMLVLNVGKEIRKDALVFAAAAEVVGAGARPEPTLIEQLLEASRKIDQDFLSRVGSFPVRIVIRYEDILPLRRRRIQLLLNAGCSILTGTRERSSLRTAIQAAFPRTHFELALSEMLYLYKGEVRSLSRAVRLPLLLVPLRELAAERLNQVMTDAAARIVRDAAALVFRR